MKYVKKEIITINSAELNNFLSSNYRLNFGDLFDISDKQVLSINKKDLNKLLTHLKIEDSSPKVSIIPCGNSHLFKSNYPFLFKIEYNVIEKENTL